MPVSHRSFLPQASELEAVLDFVNGQCSAWQIATDPQCKLLLICEELFINSAHHSVHIADALITLTLCKTPDTVVLTLEDTGTAYNPFAHVDIALHERPIADRPIGRLGIVLIQGLAKHTEYQQTNGCNKITVVVSC